MSTKVTGIKREEHATNQLFLLVVASAVFVTILTGARVNVLIPVMRAEFASSAAHLTWVMAVTVLAYAIGVPLYGHVSDYYGVRSILILGLLGFASGGILCAVAPSLVVLVGDCLETHSRGAFGLSRKLEPLTTMRTKSSRSSNCLCLNIIRLVKSIIQIPPLNK